MTLNTSNFVEESSNEVPTIPHELIIQQPAKDGDKSPMVTTQVLPAEAVNYQLRWDQALLERQPVVSKN